MVVDLSSHWGGNFSEDHRHSVATTTFYSSSNGDRWLLYHNGETGNYLVRHEPNLSSGGPATEIARPDVPSRQRHQPTSGGVTPAASQEGAAEGWCEE